MRTELIELLEAHVPKDAQEEASLRFILDFVKEREDPFTRDNLDRHVTSSAFMMHPTEASTLLVWHLKLQRWLQPGGHVESDDGSIYESARREAREETGYAALDGTAGKRIVDVDVHDIPAKGNTPAHKHLDVRFAFVVGDEVGKADHEIRWVKRQDINDLNLDPAALRALEKAFTL